MRLSIKALLVFFIVLASCAPETETTTYYLIRHAEKDRSDSLNRNPNLTEAGLKRAENWAKYFSNIELDDVYSTNYNRTIQTAQPTAKSKNLEIKSYNPRNLFDSIFQAETKGKTVLVVGHSNTTPALANRIFAANMSVAEKPIYKNMDDRDNASLYILSFQKGGFGKKKVSAKVVKVQD
ncbi:MAG: phosphoglycerate mutase [Flavobacteriaceae bacterium]|nr:phosphoglycerate mutase [Flavobacteriaceae bacterium]|tara:strand:- start:241826 stop:242365 length:540 start_codon:yes stop_codon:yes gene_type:complete